jgi:hypothetical protein
MALNVGSRQRSDTSGVGAKPTLRGHRCSDVVDRWCSLIPGLGVKLSTIILARPTVLSAADSRRKFQYVIRSAYEEHQRVAKESELRHT